MNIKSDIVVDKKITTDEIEARVLDVSQNIHASNVYASMFDGSVGDAVSKFGNGMLRLASMVDSDFTNIENGTIKIVDKKGRTVINNHDDESCIDIGNLRIKYDDVTGNSTEIPVYIQAAKLNSGSEEFHIGLSTQGFNHPSLSIVAKSKTESAIRLSSTTDFVTKTIGVDTPDVLEMNNNVYITHDTGKHTLKEIADAAYTGGGGSVDTSNFLKKNTNNLVTNGFSIMANDNSARSLSLDYIVLGTKIYLGTDYADNITGLGYYRNVNVNQHPYFKVDYDHLSTISFSLGNTARFSSKSGSVFNIKMSTTGGDGVILDTTGAKLGLGTDLLETSVYINGGAINIIDNDPTVKMKIGSNIRLSSGNESIVVPINGPGISLDSEAAIYFTSGGIDEDTLRISSNDIRLGGNYSFIFHNDNKIHLTTNLDRSHVVLTLSTETSGMSEFDAFSISTNSGQAKAFAVTCENGNVYAKVFNGVKIGIGAFEETGNLVTLTANHKNELLVNGKPVGGNSSTTYEFEITDATKTKYTFSHNAGMYPSILAFKEYVNGNGVFASEQVLVLSTTEASQGDGEYTHTSTITIQNTVVGETYTIKIS